MIQITVIYEGREVQAELLRGKHYDSVNGRITTEGCSDSDVIDQLHIKVNGDGSLFYDDMLHFRTLYIDANGNVYLLDE